MCVEAKAKIWTTLKHNLTFVMAFFFSYDFSYTVMLLCPFITFLFSIVHYLVWLAVCGISRMVLYLSNCHSYISERCFMILSTTWNSVRETVWESMKGFSCRCAQRERLSRVCHRSFICIMCFISSCHRDKSAPHDRIAQSFHSEHKNSDLRACYPS